MEDVSVIKKAAEMNAEHLLAHFDRIADAPDAIPRLRRFILDLAVRGKLVPQDPNDEPASELLKRIAEEKARLVKAGEIKKNLSPFRSQNRLTFEYSFPTGNGAYWVKLVRKLGADAVQEQYSTTGTVTIVLGDVRLRKIQASA